MKSSAILVAAWALLACEQESVCAALVLGFQDRIIQAEAGASDQLVEPYFSSSGPFVARRLGGGDYGLFDETREASASIGASYGHARSWQRSTADAQSITVVGELVADAMTGERPGLGGGSGTTTNTFDMYFTVDFLAPYDLTTNLGYSVSGEVTYNIDAARILFERLGLSGETILERRLASDPGGPQTLQVTLDPAYQYHLLAEFPLGGQLSPDDNGGASFVQTANYSVELAPLPEPGTTALLACGGLCSIVCLWRRCSGFNRRIKKARVP